MANDAYASPAIWERFRKDTYHGPRVVWGREVNLLLLGLAIRVGEGADPDGRFAGALRKTLAAVHASGLEHTELGATGSRAAGSGRHATGPAPTSALWSGTSLAVQFALEKLSD